MARSSAVGEDSEQATFAGQYVTRLNLRSEPELVDAVLAIWDSARSPSALAYRERLRLPREPKMGVVVQELVDADTAGVLFSRNPIDWFRRARDRGGVGPRGVGRGGSRDPRSVPVEAVTVPSSSESRD